MVGNRVHHFLLKYLVDHSTLAQMHLASYSSRKLRISDRLQHFDILAQMHQASYATQEFRNLLEAKNHCEQHQDFKKMR